MKLFILNFFSICLFCPKNRETSQRHYTMLPLSPLVTIFLRSLSFMDKKVCSDLICCRPLETSSDSAHMPQV